MVRTDVSITVRQVMVISFSAVALNLGFGFVELYILLFELKLHSNILFRLHYMCGRL